MHASSWEQIIRKALGTWSTGVLAEIWSYLHVCVCVLMYNVTILLAFNQLQASHHIPTLSKLAIVSLLSGGYLQHGKRSWSKGRSDGLGKLPVHWFADSSFMSFTYVFGPEIDLCVQPGLETILNWSRSRYGLSPAGLPPGPRSWNAPHLERDEWVSRSTPIISKLFGGRIGQLTDAKWCKVFQHALLFSFRCSECHHEVVTARLVALHLGRNIWNPECQKKGNKMFPCSTPCHMLNATVACY